MKNNYKDTTKTRIRRHKTTTKKQDTTKIEKQNKKETQNNWKQMQNNHRKTQKSLSKIQKDHKKKKKTQNDSYCHIICRRWEAFYKLLRGPLSLNPPMLKKQRKRHQTQVSPMSNVAAAAHLIKHKVRGTGDWITIAILGALSSEADPVSGGSRGRLSRVG